MQDIFGKDSVSVEQIVKSLSTPRLTKYLSCANGNTTQALDLYRWNARLSQSLYTYVQAWEICLRNKLNSFLIWKYNAGWPYDSRCVRNLNASDSKKLREAIDRQQRERGEKPAGTPSIVADLSAGFWVSQLSYDVPYSWRHTILGIRNRIAHHEPIFSQPLEQRHDEMRKVVSGMCTSTFRYAESMCTFAETMKERPT